MIVVPGVDDAFLLARQAHAGQVDKAGADYFTVHVLDVRDRVVAMTGDEFAAMAALLHDVVEDTDVSLDFLRSAGYPDAVVAAVDSVTRRPGEAYLAMVARAAADPIGRLVKLADNASNSSPERVAALAAIDPQKAASLSKRYEKARRILTAADVATPAE